MFNELHELAGRAVLHLMLVAEGDKLRVTLQPKPTGKKGDVPQPMIIVATPAELDAGFAQAVNTYQAPALSVLEQAQAQAKAVAEKPVAKKSAPAVKKAKVAKPAAKKTAPTKKAAPAKKPAAAPKKAAKPKASTGSKSQVSREDLIDMMRQFLAALGDKKPARAAFIKKFPGGRRYERLFPGANGFKEFVDAARQQSLPGLEQPADTAAPPAAEETQTTAPAADEAPASDDSTALDEQDEDLPALSIF